MSSAKSIKAKKFIRTLFSEDVKTILIFLVFILTVFSVYGLFIGWFGGYGAGFLTPSISIAERSLLEDSDRDLLPDVVEMANPGEQVYVDGVAIRSAIGTGTDPYDADTDGDGFTDGLEDNWGTNPNSWISPGFIWIIWGLSIAVALYFKYREPDMLREYREFEQLESSGVSGKKSGKYAYGSSSVFSNRSSEMTEDERRKSIEGDIRFHKMTGDYVPEKTKYKRNWTKIGIQIFVAGFVTAVIIFILKLS